MLQVKQKTWTNKSTRCTNKNWRPVWQQLWWRQVRVHCDVCHQAWWVKHTQSSTLHCVSRRTTVRVHGWFGCQREHSRQETLHDDGSKTDLESHKHRHTRLWRNRFSECRRRIHSCSRSQGNQLQRETVCRWWQWRFTSQLEDVSKTQLDSGCLPGRPYTACRYDSWWISRPLLWTRKYDKHAGEAVYRSQCSACGATYRRVPFLLRKQVEQQLKQDEELAVIERVDGATLWVSPIVVVLKPKHPE